MDGRMDEWMDGWTDGWMDGRTDGHVEFGRVNTFVACGWNENKIDYVLKRSTSHVV